MAGEKAFLALAKLKRMTRNVFKEIVDKLTVFLLSYW
jgi:hypothetical protein